MLQRNLSAVLMQADAGRDERHIHHQNNQGISRGSERMIAFSPRPSAALVCWATDPPRLASGLPQC